MPTLSSFRIETHDLAFVNTETITVAYAQAYSSTPTITATAVANPSLSGDAVNVYVENVGMWSVDIRISAITNVNVHVQIIGT